MNILCIFPAAPNSLWDYTQKIGGLPPLPGYITKRNTHVNKLGAADQIVILYEFDKSNFAEAMGYICRQLSSLRDDVSEISVSAHAYSPHPCFLKLEKGGEV